MAPENTNSMRRRSMVVIPHPRSNEQLKSLRYEEMRAARPPIPVTISPPRAPPSDTHPALRRPSTSPAHSVAMKRDSGLAPMTPATARENSVGSISEKGEEVLHVKGRDGVVYTAPSTPRMVEKNADYTAPSTPRRVEKNVENAEKDAQSVGNDPPQTPTTAGNSKSTNEEDFSPITTSIPSDSLLASDFLDSMSFSKRGSILLSGKKLEQIASAMPTVTNPSPQPRLTGGRRMPSFSMLADSTGHPLSDELEKESQKVRSMYETGQDLDWQDGKWSAGGDKTLFEEDATVEVRRPHTSATNLGDRSMDFRPASMLSNTRDSIFKGEHELAGGIEDWEDVNGKDVDRYGFITMRRNNSIKTGDPALRTPYRVSTLLQLASEAPRRRRTALGRALSKRSSVKSIGPRRTPSRRTTGLSIRSNTSASTFRSTSRSGMRSAVNRLPGNRDRRWMDEASDMLTLPPGLEDIAEEDEGGKLALNMKKKEWERTEKWRRMAKLVNGGREGEGMKFEFDAKSSKVIDRTWKGIPDRWRATAWFSFLGQSAKKKEGSKSDSDIVDGFYRLLARSSPDDVQIDIDVPRTINSHIMFRRRYRGGQRLLFRVLHALSLYFPETGYVQGMASLAATLLCYFDEERAFIMLVRMWELRGLDKLYSHGFGGLMSALDEFSTRWIGDTEVKDKLTELCIDPTAYGTRWYLTLFNYSIPFAAQLRVWDIFMLLGDSDPTITPTDDRPFAGGLDILHATSAALIDGTRDILLDSDFENAMKVLTSWIPVKDEDLLMKVAKAEWKLRKGRRS